ncbi:hypothetical protein H5410_064835 [Solanum commersonii]|uniref:DUF4283 domain-containing protein n=1 Tax=Solanum commersonii TaxID=4109 RepID=A0A9J5VYX3_SOLCO|nr:hypothetical protein H5410_064835 [Solanum commersonii]
MEVIRKSFIAQTQLTGGVKIVHFNSRHIYIDLDNEANHIYVWTKQKMFIAELPWHCHYMDILTPLLSPIGKALYLDSATVQKTRSSVAKVRVQIDLTKERPQHVWLGFSEKDPNLGKWQVIEYQDVPSYCIYCKHQGHMIGKCSQKEKDEETKKNKELEANKKELDKQQNQSSKGNRARFKSRKTCTQSSESINLTCNTSAKGMTSKTLSLERLESVIDSYTPPPVIIEVDHCSTMKSLPCNSPILLDDQCDHIPSPSPGCRLKFWREKGVPKGRDKDQTPATTQSIIPHHQKKSNLTRDEGKETPNQQIHISKANRNQPKGSMAKDMGNKAAARKKQNEQNLQKQPPNNSHPEENPCIDFIMMDQIMDVVPLNAKKPPDQSKVNVRDEYDVDNLEDDFDPDNLPTNALDEEDEISELLIKAFSPNKDHELEKELQQVTDKQGLSPRGIHLSRLPLKKTDSPIPVTAGRPNTRLFTSRSSQ